MRDRDLIKSTIHDALRRHFPTDTVDVSDGYGDNIHVLVVSRRFDNHTSREASESLWSILDRETDLSNAEKGQISLMLALSPAVLK